MSRITHKIISSAVVLPLLLMATTTASYGNVGGPEIQASSEVLQTAYRPNSQQQSRLSPKVEDISNTRSVLNLTISRKLERTRQLPESKSWAKAARNEKTRECRVSGLCS